MPAVIFFEDGFCYAQTTTDEWPCQAKRFDTARSSIRISRIFLIGRSPACPTWKHFTTGFYQESFRSTKSFAPGGFEEGGGDAS
jgi:hypothetical protein